MKTCTKCKIEKSLDEFYTFDRSPDGLAPACKECTNIYKATWYQKNKEKIKLRARLRYHNNTEKIRRKQKEYNKQHRLEILARRKKHYKENKDRLLEKQKNYREENKEEIILRNKLPSKNPNLELPPCDNPLLTAEGWTVACKMCGKRTAPTRVQIQNRMRAYTGKRGGEDNFYCSDKCKDTCPIYRFLPHQSTDHRSNQFVPKNATKHARACQTDHLKQLQCDEVGHNYCEKCGDIIDVELHHTQPAGTVGAINSAGHILLCAGCHVSLEATCS